MLRGALGSLRRRATSSANAPTAQTTASTNKNLDGRLTRTGRMTAAFSAFARGRPAPAKKTQLAPGPSENVTSTHPRGAQAGLCRAGVQSGSQAGPPAGWKGPSHVRGKSPGWRRRPPRLHHRPAIGPRPRRPPAERPARPPGGRRSLHHRPARASGRQGPLRLRPAAPLAGRKSHPARAHPRQPALHHRPARPRPRRALHHRPARPRPRRGDHFLSAAPSAPAEPPAARPEPTAGDHAMRSLDNVGNFFGISGTRSTARPSWMPARP